MEIPIKIQTKFAIAVAETAVIIANKTNIHPRADIHHQKEIVFLFCIQKNISIHHLMNAHRANIHIINFPTKLASRAHTSINQRITTNIPIANKNDTYGVCVFFIAFVMDDTPEKIRAIHSRIFMIHQNFQGLNAVKNQNIINKTANHNRNQDGHPFIFSDLFN
jgi:hypothetical protein